MPDQPNNNPAIRKILQNEITQLIGIIAIVYSFVALVILPIKSIEQTLESIKTNDIPHIYKQLEKQDNEISQWTQEIVRLRTLLEK